MRIIDNRLKNPAMVIRHKMPVDAASVGKELEVYTRRRLGIPDPQPVNPVNLIMPGLSAAVVGSLDGIKKLAASAALVMGFEKSGQAPAAKELAEERAAVCAVCPMTNRTKMEEWRNLPVAAGLIRNTPRTASLKLSVTSDAKLALCDGMLCPSSYLVHIPGEFIKGRVREEVRNGLDAACWLRKL